MSDLISRKLVINYLREQHDSLVIEQNNPLSIVHPEALKGMNCSNEAFNHFILGLPTAYNAKDELRLLENYLYHKPKTYRARNANHVVVRDLLMSQTSHAGMTSCIMKCRELGIDPYGYDLKGAVKDE